MRTPGQAFTLIELLVVVAIIAVIIALLTPALDAAMASAERAVCQSRFHNFGYALHTYAMDEKRWFPPIKYNNQIGGQDSDTWAPPSAPRHFWPTNKKFADLLGVGTIYTGAADNRYLMSSPGVFCPSAPNNPNDRDRRAFWQKYAFNTSGFIWYDPMVLSTRVSDRVGRSPGDMLQMVDANNWFANKPGADYRNNWDIDGEYPTANTNGAAPMFRHLEGANVLHFDASTAWYHKTEMATYNADGTLHSIHPMWNIFRPGTEPDPGFMGHGWVPNPFNVIFGP